MKNAGFKIVEELPSADFIFDAFGESLEELFVNCARACFFAMTDIETVDRPDSRDISVAGETVEDLLFAFIAELIYLKDTENIFLSRFEIEIAPDGKTLKGVVRGEAIDYNKHVIKTDVKAATYHDLHVRKDRQGFSVRMILDL